MLTFLNAFLGTLDVDGIQRANLMEILTRPKIYRLHEVLQCHT